MGPYPEIELMQEHGVLEILLNRPDSLNALTEGLLDSLGLIFDQAKADGSVRAVILGGRGRGFCSGQDLKSLHEGPGRDVGRHVDQYYNPLIKKIYHLPKPTVAMVGGVAAGAGMSLAMACDFRVASYAARFVQAFVRIGLVPDSGSSFFLPRLLGMARALELAMLGDVISGEEAYANGLVTKLVDTDRLREETWELARRLADGPPVALEMIKQAIHEGTIRSLDDTLTLESDLQSRAAQTEDHQIGLRAFLNKQPARFIGW